MRGGTLFNKAIKDRLVVQLWVLLLLFVLRVLGQMLVAIGWRWFLAPMHEWSSGLLAYRYLLPLQIVIIFLYGKVCLSFTRGAGFMVAPRRKLGRALLVLGIVYFASMIIRYAVTMALHPERRWTGGSIPIFFHLVLSAFILSLGRYHNLNGRETDSPQKWKMETEAECPQPIITL